MATVPNFYRIESSTYALRGYNQFLTTLLDNGGGRLRLPCSTRVHRNPVLVVAGVTPPPHR